MKLTKEDIDFVREIWLCGEGIYPNACRDVQEVIRLDKLREVIISIETDTQDCFTGLTKDDDWQSGAGFVLKLMRERIGEVLEGELKK